MTWIAEARVPTAEAGKYVAQVCKHWARTVEVAHQGNVGRITFPHNARGSDWPGEAVVTCTSIASPSASRRWRTTRGPGRLPSRAGRRARRQTELTPLNRRSLPGFQPGGSCA
ncbi:MAG: DUF2218 domain-containing protein [Novosphingobium sp.]